MIGHFFWNLAAFVVALGILITIHEFGHFWVARRCGIFVERFSIGFGRTLWRYQDKKGTEFVIALIPLGGYVKMLDERAEPVAEAQRPYAFNNKTVGQRAAVVSAGPIANFLLAVLVYWWVFISGVSAVKPVVGSVTQGSIAQKAGVAANWQIKQVAGNKTTDWQDVQLALVAQIGSPSITLTLAPFKGEASGRQVILDTSGWQFQPDRQDPLTTLGIVPILPKAELQVAQLADNSAAVQAGLQIGDTLLAINHQPLTDWAQFVDIIHQQPEKRLLLTVLRQQKSLTLPLTPTAKRDPDGKIIGFVGIVPKVEPLASEYLFTKQYNPATAFIQAWEKTGQLIKLTLAMTGKLITGDVKLNNLSGPIAIAQGAGTSAEYGVTNYLLFLALISINLGIINLFPLPVLDGGHLLFLAIEKIQGKPVSERLQAAGYRIGIMCLILLMGLAFFNDISRLLVK